MDMVPWENVGLVGIAAFLILLVVPAIVTGRLVPQRTVDREREQQDAQITFLQQALISSQEVNVELSQQNRELLVTARVANVMLDAVHPVPPRQIDNGGGSHVG